MLPALFSPGDRDQTQRMTPSLGPALMNYPLASASRSLDVPAASRAGASSSRDWASAPDANGAPSSGPDWAGFGIRQIVPRGKEHPRRARSLDTKGCLSGEATN